MHEEDINKIHAVYFFAAVRAVSIGSFIVVIIKAKHLYCGLVLCKWQNADEKYIHKTNVFIGWLVQKKYGRCIWCHFNPQMFYYLCADSGKCEKIEVWLILIALCIQCLCRQMRERLWTKNWRLMNLFGDAISFNLVTTRDSKKNVAFLLLVYLMFISFCIDWQPKQSRMDSQNVSWVFQVFCVVPSKHQKWIKSRCRNTFGEWLEPVNQRIEMIEANDAIELLFRVIERSFSSSFRAKALFLRLK